MKTKTIKSKGGKKFNMPTEKQAAKNAAVVQGTSKKKAQAISTRLPEVVVEYDFRKDGVVERRQKHFKDANKAKQFFVKKDKLGKKPLVVSGTHLLTNEKFPLPAKQLKLKLSPKHGPQSLAEAFPPEPVSTTSTPTQASGDPTRTTFDKTKAPEIGLLVPASQTDEERAAEARKAAKHLKRKQKKGELLWKTKDTRTIVGIQWYTPKGHSYARWIAKFSNGTEEEIRTLTVVYSRDHVDHHIRTPTENFIDGLNNKDYELILKQAQAYAERQANYYRASIRTFRGSDVVQKEMEKRTSKKGVKGDEPLTPQQVELANKLAELANYYCCSVGSFFMLPNKLKKSSHARLSIEQVMDVFEKQGIDEMECTIRVVQLAKRLLGRMVPRLEVGGPQVGTPELARNYQRAQATKQTAAKAATLQATAGALPAKPTIAIQTGEGKDQWGSKLGTKGAEINATLFNGKVPAIVSREWLLKTVGGTLARINSHTRYLFQAGLLAKAEGGWQVVGAAKPQAPKAEPMAKTGKGTKKPKSALAKAAGKAKAGKPKAAKAGKSKGTKAKAKKSRK